LKFPKIKKELNLVRLKNYNNKNEKLIGDSKNFGALLLFLREFTAFPTSGIGTLKDP